MNVNNHQSNKSNKSQSNKTNKSQSNKNNKSQSNKSNKSQSNKNNKSQSNKSNKSQSNKTNKPQSNKTNKSQSNKTNKSQSNKTNKSQSNKTNKSQSNKTNKPQSNKNNKLKSNRTKIHNNKLPVRANNIFLHKDSKYNIKKFNFTKKCYLIKSKHKFYINGIEVLMKSELLDLLQYNFVPSESVKLSFEGTIVLIENKESFDFSDEIFSEDEYLFIYYGGTNSDKQKQIIKENIFSDKIIYFGDFDFASIIEYNKLKKVINNIELYYGNNLKDLENKIITYGNHKLYESQVDNYNNCNIKFDKISKSILKLIIKHRKGLEQEIFHSSFF